MRRFLLFTFATTLLALGQTRLTTGTVRGIIREPGGNALPDATVVLGPDLGSKSPTAFTAYVITGSDGRFEIPNVPPGSYWVCPQFANSDYLNPCVWDLRPPSVIMTAAGVAIRPDLDLTLARGTSLFVQVDDPHALLGPKEDLAIGARSISGNHAYAQPPLKTLGGQRLYRVIVPLGAPYVPVLGGGRFQVDHGAPGERLASPFEKVAESKIGEAPKVFRLSVRAVTK